MLSIFACDRETRKKNLVYCDKQQEEKRRGERAITRFSFNSGFGDGLA
jgi:hypothetical protein